MGWAMIMLLTGTCVLAAVCGGLYDGGCTAGPDDSSAGPTRSETTRGS